MIYMIIYGSLGSATLYTCYTIRACNLKPVTVVLYTSLIPRVIERLVVYRTGVILNHSNSQFRASTHYTVLD